MVVPCYLIRSEVYLQSVCMHITEAVEAIVEYSSSADELFHRQKLKKEHLKDYLMKVCKSRHLQLVGKSDKESLIKLTKEIWKEEKEKIDEKQVTFFYLIHDSCLHLPILFRLIL